MAASDQDLRERDWLLYGLLLAATLCLPLAIQNSKWVPEGGRLAWAGFWAVLLGILVMRTKWPGWLVWLLGIVLGLEYSVQFAGKLLPRPGLLWNDAGRLLGWLWGLWTKTGTGAAPASRAWAFFVTQANALWSNLLKWYQTVQAGEPSKEPAALWLPLALGIWLLSWNASYQLLRRRRPFAALLPLGIAVVSNVAFTDLGMAYVHSFLAITLLTLVWSNAIRMEELWARLKLDFSPDLRRDALTAGAALSGLAIVVALAVPYVTYNPAVFAFWDFIQPHVEPFYENLGRAFAGRNPVPKPTPSVKGYALGAHAVGGGTNPTSTAVFWVRTSDPVPVLPEEQMAALGDIPIEELLPKRYWRQRTYDYYTGHGWSSSEATTELLLRNTNWIAIPYPHTLVTQTFELRDLPALAFGVNEPVKVVDKDYRVLARGEEDMISFSVEAKEYKVVSAVPEVTVSDLRNAEGPYPDWVKERYLQLPKIPERVRQKAEEVVQQAGATTRYDKARAIEAYLRNFPYDLNLDPPPFDADVVDYFLFRAQRGYCDYSATAMAVMLRAVGVAARYASGYNTGTYSPEAGFWVVRETNAHAWTEVYFPGYGWIEFEPTPTQRVFTWPDSHLVTVGPLPGAEPPAQPAWRSISPLIYLGGGLALLLLVVIIWPPRWFRRPRNPRRVVFKVYGKLVRRARWLGQRPADGQTPNEFLAALARAIEQRGHFGGSAERDVGLIGQVYQRARYDQRPIALEDSYRVEGAWRRLRLRLWWLPLRRGPRAVSSA